MGDDQNQDATPDPFEEEIGDLLAEAEALTSELSGEVGESAHDATRDADFFASESDSEASTDQQVHDAEQALAATTNELGGEPPTAPSTPLKLPSSGALTLPKKGATPKPAAGATVTLPTGSSPTGSSAVKTEALVAAKTPEPAIETKPPAVSPRAAHYKKKLAELSEHLEPVSRVVGTVLDTLDRPFTRIQFRTRVLMGWLALMLLVAAISLWLFVIR